MDIFEGIEEPKHFGHKYNVCASCGRSKVLKPGDYCKNCAVLDNPLVVNKTYIVITRHNVADTAWMTGMDGSFLMQKHRYAYENACVYVLFYARGEWQDIIIDERFHVPTVMKNLISRLED